MVAHHIPNAGIIDHHCNHPLCDPASKKCPAKPLRARLLELQVSGKYAARNRFGIFCCCPSAIACREQVRERMRVVKVLSRNRINQAAASQPTPKFRPAKIFRTPRIVCSAADGNTGW